MEIVTGYVGRPHVTAEQDRAQNQGVFGVESYVLNVGQKMAAGLQSNNEIRIRDGVLVHQGCTGVVKTGTYDPVTITNGTQGMKRIDLIVARYTKNAETNVENLAWKVIQGTPAASNPAIPSYIEGDIQAGDLISDMPMYEIHLDGITVSEVKAVFTALKTGAEMQADISSLNSNLDNGNIGGFRITHKRIILSYETATSLSGYAYCGGNVIAANATIIYQTSTPIDQVDRIYITIGAYGAPGRINVYAQGSGFISGHVLAVDAIIITEPI